MTTTTTTTERYTLRNDYHGTTTKVITASATWGDDVIIRLSESQIRRVANALCGSPDCTCGGVRGPQQARDGRRLIVDNA